MIVSNELVEGTFIEESKNRFICRVNINEVIYECHVPNSSRMENYLKLNQRRILVSKNKDTGRRTNIHFSLLDIIIR
jgi:DNA-binding sugar fermentation-stimulating protein